MSKIRYGISEYSLQNLKPGDEVSLIVSSSIFSGHRWSLVTVKRTTKTFIELIQGNRFSVKTGKEIKSNVCKSPEYSSLFIDPNNAYWDAKDSQTLLDFPPINGQIVTQMSDTG